MPEKTNLDATVENVHDLFQKTPAMVEQTSPHFNGGGTLHYAIEEIKSPKITAYLLCRGQNVTIEGINCLGLTPMNLNILNAAGETALELAEIELLKLPTYTNIDDIVAIKLINDFIELAEAKNFREIEHKIENYEATYNTEKNIFLAHPRETDITKPPTPTKIKFKEGTQLTHVEKNTMPHYPSFDKEWKEQDTDNTRSVFIDAYQNNNFSLMEAAINKYNIKFKGSDTVSELAYKAVDRGCLHMTYNLVKQGSASHDYIPEGKTETLQEKYNMKKAKIAADNQVPTGLAIKLKRSATTAELTIPGDTNLPKKQDKTHAH
jgi:hypothetical protein